MATRYNEYDNSIADSFTCQNVSDHDICHSYNYCYISGKYKNDSCADCYAGYCYRCTGDNSS